MNRFFGKPHKQFIVAGGWLTVSGLLAGICGYAFQILMGCLLEKETFSLFSALNALTMVLASPLAAFVMLIARRVASLQAIGHNATVVAMYRYWHIRLVLISVMLACVVALGMPVIQTFVKTSDRSVIWLFFGIVVGNAFVLMNAGFFQGLHAFGWLGSLSILPVTFKILLSYMLIAFLDLGVWGALSGMLFASVVTWMSGMMRLLQLFSKVEQRETVEPFGFQWSETVPVICASGSFTLLSQLDIPLANYFFEPDLAGSYSAAAVLGKAVLYIPGGLVMALFPMVAANIRTHSSNKALLYQSFFLTLLLCSAAALMYMLMSDFFIGLFFHEQFPEAAEILRFYGFAMVPLALVLVLKNYAIASGYVFFSWILMGFAFIMTVTFPLLNPNPENLVLLMATCATLCGVVGCSIYLAPQRSQRCLFYVTYCFRKWL